MTTQNTSSKASTAKSAKAKTTSSESIKDRMDSAARASTAAAQEGFDKVLKSAAEYGSFVKANNEAMVESLSMTSKGIEALNAEATSYLKSSLENGVATAQAMAGAKSLQDMVELQADYAKASMESWLAELTTLGGLTSSLFKTALAPINDRVAATVELAKG